MVGRGAGIDYDREIERDSRNSPTPIHSSMSDLPAPNAEDFDDRPEVVSLLKRLKAALPELEQLLEECTGHWGYEDPIYRFYHQSFKVYQLQKSTLGIVDKLQTLAPNQSLNDWFMQVIREGTGKTFVPKDNEKWLQTTRPILEAFFHARFFLKMAVKHGRELEYPSRAMPSGWAALLYLYNLR
jgi:hypothetical protein